MIIKDDPECINCNCTESKTKLNVPSKCGYHIYKCNSCNSMFSESNGKCRMIEKGLSKVAAIYQRLNYAI